MKSMIAFEGSRSRYNDISPAVRTVMTNGKFSRMVLRKGGPILRTREERMYWKQEVRKRIVFWEFLMLEWLCLSLGGR